MTTKIINFDMDGTIADLYGVTNWLDYLIAEDETPYAVARPLVNMNVLARYDKKVTTAKRNWLKKHLKSVKFNNIFIVPYGTPKYTLANGILFDDEARNRDESNGTAYNVDNIIGVLKGLA